MRTLPPLLPIIRRVLLIAPILALLLLWTGSLPGQQTQQHGSFLTWNAPSIDAAHSPATAYNVYRATSAGGPYALIANVTTTSYVDPIGGLTTGTTYFYVIRSVNSVGTEGAASSEVSGLIPNASGAVVGLVDVVK